jgi:hypothetical protein
MHYPGKYSNDPNQSEEICKDKVVLNQPAGNVEFVNTKDEESVSITHKSGSYIKLDKFGRDDLTTRDKREHVLGDFLSTINGSQTEIIEENFQTIVLGDTLKTVGDVARWREPMQNIKDAYREIHDVKRLFEVKRTNRENSIDQAPKQSKAGTPAKCPSHGNVSKVIINNSPTVVTSTKVNSREVMSVRDGKEGYANVSGSGGNLCLTCWGKMISPSSQDGGWATETQKNAISQKREEIQKRIYEYEKQLGQNKCPNGGSSIETIAKHFVQNIGLVFNDFESFRKDPYGKLVPCGVKIDPLGTTIYTQYRETALIENVDIDKFPGGSYELNVCDGWTATVGSHGIEFKTSGPLNLFGTIVNVIGEEVSIGSRGELALDGERVDITGEVISLRPKRLSRTLDTGGQTQIEQQVLVDGNLNVGLNAVIRGGAHVEGELSVHHITAPCEYHITETDFTYDQNFEPRQLPPPSPDICIFGQNGVKIAMDPQDCTSDAPKSPTYATLLPGAIIGYAVSKDSGGNDHCLPVFSVSSPNFAVVDKHYHYFKNMPMKLFEQNSQVEANAGAQSAKGSANPHDAVRAVGARNNWSSPVLAQPVKNSTTENTVVEKFGGNGCSTLSINQTDWGQTSSKNDSLPSGEGVRTQKYTDEYIQQRVKVLEAELEAKYAELKAELNKLSQSDC